MDKKIRVQGWVQMKRMSVLKVLTLILLISGIVFVMASCGSSASTTAATQTTTVKSGNLAVTVTGTGNLALEDIQQLSFGQTGTASQASTAKISEVDVVAGQTVQQGQVLVKADPTDWQNQITADQHALDSAQSAVTQAQSGVTQAQAKVVKDQQGLLQDQANLIKAQQNLSSQQDVQKIQNQINNANIQLQQAQILLQQAVLSGNGADIPYWQNQINYLSVNTHPGSSASPDGGEIGVLQSQMQQLLTDPANAGASLSSINSIAQIQQAELAVQNAQAQIVTDQANMANDQASVVEAQNNVVLAQNKADDAQTTLTNDQNSPQQIVAPFDGLITQVNVTQGQIVQRSATLIEIADPNKYVANIMVTEIDVESIKMGGSAEISFNALPGMTFPGKITQIAPLATIQQGVVNYQVTVELTSTTPVSPTRTNQGSGSSFTPGNFASGSRPTGSSSSTGSTFTSRAGSAAGGFTGGSGLPNASSTSNVVLRDGLSATVTIPIQEATNVLIVPSRAITTTAQGSTVQVVNGSTTETVTVHTGITDGVNTEITSGLSEGQQILIPSFTSSSSSSSSSNNRPGGGGFFIGR